MQPDGGLARAGSALHGEELVQGGPDDLVLLGLNGGDDVEHLARASPLELGQQRVAAAQPGGRGLVTDAAEEVVGHSDDGAAVDHDLATPGQPQGILGAGPVEGDGHRGPPVDHHGIRTRSSSTWRRPMCQRRALLLVDAPEEQRSRAVRQERDPAARVRRRSRGPGSRRRSGPAAGRSARCRMVRQRMRAHGRGRPARRPPRDRTGEWPRSSPPNLRQNTRKSARAKVPGHSGDSTSFRPLEQALQLVFRLLVRLDFEPLTKGPYCRSL